MKNKDTKMDFVEWVNKEKNMTKTELIAELNKKADVKFTHRSFSSDEYLVNKKDGYIYDENGYLFETFDESDNFHNGLRIRTGSSWEDGWTIIEDKPKEIKDNFLYNVITKVRWQDDTIEEIHIYVEASSETEAKKIAEERLMDKKAWYVKEILWQGLDKGVYYLSRE